MSAFIIEGGHPLKGTVNPMPNKNSIVALIPAAILADEPVTFHNVPKSSSVRVLLQIFRLLGGKVSYLKGGSIRLNSSAIDKYSIPKELANKERSANMFLAPLLSRFGKAEMSDMGGCKLGNRPLDTLIQGLTQLGAQVDPDNIFSLTAKELNGNPNIWQIEASVTGTESTILAAVKAKGKTVIYNAAAEPHVQDLCNFLVSIGAHIDGIGTNRLEVEGVERLGGGEWTVIPDHIDIGGLIVAAAITGGDILIKDAIPQHMKLVLQYFEKINLQYDIQDKDIHIPADQNLYCKPNVKGDMDKIIAIAWPMGFPMDLIPQAVVLASMAEGNIRVLNNMYETQLVFVEDYIKMNAKVVLADPSRVITFGPSQLKGSILSAPPVLQSAHALAIAALAAKGITKILNADIISRRYPDFVDIFSSLGASVRKE
ncbi:UDP-N-acetylglucosamine 1-carboxyvinyltransferase [Candidatus Dojkabacteria bacterium]|uniref:UDP-N-acetylglucosamine 1-carboxyvinyltransferase n=1 Tax=Candidatus Dojkabacteria bacterium TaxID=2099670 RepID=A0A955HYW4_9BACT|nr:UDP-N-acetylglucosamine 1-carboxyvinyltransferase [Candidatus Dojkabacteria bacterium]